MIHGKCKGWHSTKWSSDQCRVCWRKRDPATQRYVADSTPPKVTKTRGVTAARISLAVVGECEHRGRLLSRPQSCSKTWKYECDLHVSCTLSQCEGCRDYVSEATNELPRHLCYYVYPVAGNGTWERNVDQLLERMHLFTGRRVIAIATHSERHKLDSPDSVRHKLLDYNCDILLVPHGARNLGEVTAFVPMLTRVSHLPGYTFYAHAKGVTKNPGDPAIHRWTTLMYKSNLDQWERVQESLRQHPITGAFRKDGLAFRGRVTHHYTGTFYWFRNDAIFSRDWRNVPPRYGGTEMWPGLIASREECGCHFGLATGRVMYDPNAVTEFENLYEH